MQLLTSTVARTSPQASHCCLSYGCRPVLPPPHPAQASLHCCVSCSSYGAGFEPAGTGLSSQSPHRLQRANLLATVHSTDRVAAGWRPPRRIPLARFGSPSRAVLQRNLAARRSSRPATTTLEPALHHRENTHHGSIISPSLTVPGTRTRALVQSFSQSLIAHRARLILKFQLREQQLLPLTYRFGSIKHHLLPFG